MRHHNDEHGTVLTGSAGAPAPVDCRRVDGTSFFFKIVAHIQLCHALSDQVFSSKKVASRTPQYDGAL